MTRSDQLSLIVEKLLPVVLAWGFTNEDLLRAIELARLPVMFVVYSPRYVTVDTDARHRQKMRERGETLERCCALDARTSPGASTPRSCHLFVFVTRINSDSSLRADWQVLPEHEGTTVRRRELKPPKMPIVDPGGQGHTADVGAKRLQRLLDRR